MLSENDKVPNLALPNDLGGTTKLSSLKGQVVVLYFYPKDDTPGCTTQAKDFTCSAGAFKAAGAQIIGVSPDSVASHAKFRAKHALEITLAADEDHAVATAFGVWVEKYMGVERSTFLIDKTGKIARVWRKVKVAGHIDEVLEAVKSLER
jgi:thioredoxin-dependent peroxiredoxin